MTDTTVSAAGGAMPPTSTIHSERAIITSATDVARSQAIVAAASAELSPTRRIFLAHAASSAVLATAVAPVRSVGIDPIFAAMQAHKAAVIALGLMVDLHSELDRELPIEKCRSRVTAWEEEIVSTDDPHWIECERDLMAAFDRETDAAIELVNARPTTGAGLLALLQYAVAADTDGELWPDLLHDENSKRSRPWHHFLIVNLIEALPGMVFA
jgi:hypothetical protein